MELMTCMVFNSSLTANVISEWHTVARITDMEATTKHLYKSTRGLQPRLCFCLRFRIRSASLFPFLYPYSAVEAFMRTNTIIPPNLILKFAPSLTLMDNDCQLTPRDSRPRRVTNMRSKRRKVKDICWCQNALNVSGEQYFHEIWEMEITAPYTDAVCQSSFSADWMTEIQFTFNRSRPWTGDWLQMCSISLLSQKHCSLIVMPPAVRQVLSFRNVSITLLARRKAMERLQIRTKFDHDGGGRIVYCHVSDLKI